MLAVRGEPFDSPEYLFEVKWNGIRALASRSHESQPTGGWDLWGRELADYRSRYPEMQVLAALPPGTILDGELVLLSQGLPDLEAILARHQLSHPAKIQHASRQQPVTYVVFDLLAHHGRSLVGQPLHERRALLQDLLARWQEPRVLFSEGIVGAGPGVLRTGGAPRSGRDHGKASGQSLSARKTLFVLAQDQTRAAFALRHHGLGAWRPGAARSLGGGAVGRPVALRGQRAHGVYRPGAAPLASRVGGPRPHPAGGALSAPGAVGGAGSLVPGQLPGMDASGPLTRCQLPWLVGRAVSLRGFQLPRTCVNFRVKKFAIPFRGARGNRLRNFDTMVYTMAKCPFLRGFLSSRVN